VLRQNPYVSNLANKLRGTLEQMNEPVEVVMTYPEDRPRYAQICKALPVAILYLALEGKPNLPISGFTARPHLGCMHRVFA